MCVAHRPYRPVANHIIYLESLIVILVGWGSWGIRWLSWYDMAFPFVCCSACFFFFFRSFCWFYSTMYSTEDIFSPPDVDVSVQTPFGYRYSQPSSVAPVYIPSSSCTSTCPSKLKKSVSYTEVSNNTDSIISTQYTMSEFEKAVVEETEMVKRGWRFYGTFACLALLNLICAIDATVSKLIGRKFLTLDALRMAYSLDVSWE